MPEETSFWRIPLCSISSTSLAQYEDASWVRADISRVLSAPLAIAARTLVQPSNASTSDEIMPSTSSEKTDM